MNRVHTVLLASPGKWAGLRADPSVDGISSPCPPHHRTLNVSPFGRGDRKDRPSVSEGSALGFRAMSL